MIMDGLMHHAAREMPKVVPTAVIVGSSWFLAFPWQQVGAFIGCVLGLVTLAYTAWKWKHEAAQKQTPRPTVPPAHDA